MSEWYQDGLRFSCQQCGKCCTGEPGHVWVTEDEIHDMADALGMDVEAFRYRYTENVSRRGVSLREKPDNSYDCVFYDKKQGCTLYEQRPRQCRTWPFWRSNLRSEDDWKLIAEDCPGVNTGKMWSHNEITEQVMRDGLPGGQ